MELFLRHANSLPAFRVPHSLCAYVPGCLLVCRPTLLSCLQVEAGDDLLCKRATGPDLKVACKQSCGTACESALAAYEARLTAETGLVLDAKERGRVLKNCRHSCSYECTKSGKSHDFVVPSRR